MLRLVRLLDGGESEGDKKTPSVLYSPFHRLSVRGGRRRPRIHFIVFQKRGGTKWQGRLASRDLFDVLRGEGEGQTDKKLWNFFSRSSEKESDPGIEKIDFVCQQLPAISWTPSLSPLPLCLCRSMSPFLPTWVRHMKVVNEPSCR